MGEKKITQVNQRITFSPFFSKYESKFSLQGVSQASYILVGNMGCKTLTSLKTSTVSTRLENQASTWMPRSDPWLGLIHCQVSACSTFVLSTGAAE